MIKSDILTPKQLKSETRAEFDLYSSYKHELWQFTGDHYSNEAVHSWYVDIIESESYLIRLYDISKKIGEQIGFVVIGVNSNCHRDANFYVQDCYLEPQYRKRHIMSDVVQEFIKQNPGVYCLFLIDTNLPAINFWNRMFQLQHYKEKKIIDYEMMGTENCHLHGYYKIKGLK